MQKVACFLFPFWCNCKKLFGE